MISFENGVFKLTTERTSYWFRVTRFGHLEHIYYGSRLPEEQDIEPLLLKRTAVLGSSVLYDPADETYCLDSMCLEWSGIGKGDYRSPAAEIKMPDGSFCADFVYNSHSVVEGTIPSAELPIAHGEKDECETLGLVMRDESCKVSLLLCYTVFFETNVITRRAVLRNENENPLCIRKLMSASVDLPDDNFRLITLDGGWIKEGIKHERKLSYGIHVNSSITGASSNRHNPGFILAADGTRENEGSAFGFNLVYSGNHHGALELSTHDLVRVQLGINPHCFEWVLKANEEFFTPEAVLSFSDKGLNGLSQNFHSFINRHVVPSDWAKKERPVLLNNWEAHFFKFTREKLLTLARRGKDVGIELFVLDDGWFGKRDDDKAGLGDYNVNRKKLTRGLEEFSERIHEMGMKFGLWFEPEMVNPDSDLFRAHPEYAVQTPGKNPGFGRNQLVLDLCNSEVRDYIVEKVTKTLDSCKIDYVKWDYNRHISDAFSVHVGNQGEFFHRYILGLYDVLGRIFTPRPHILFESCSSGGNRFDLGMLSFSPQIWTSDNTDPVERLKIQEGLSYLYPPSCMGAHVSEAPHQQTLRDTPLATRFNVAAFGNLGYELDLKFLTHVQKMEVKEQVAFYKEYRKTLQFGTFWRGESFKENKKVWHSVSGDGKMAITGFFQTQANASEGFDRLRFMGLLRGKKYNVQTRPQRLFIKRFGGLVKHIMPVSLNPEGIVLRTANKYKALTDCTEQYCGFGETLMDYGILLNNQFAGSYYNEQTRLLGDFGSNLYVTTAQEDIE